VEWKASGVGTNDKARKNVCGEKRMKDFLDFLGWKGATQLSSGAVCPA
jgi:hypothetical protein